MRWLPRATLARAVLARAALPLIATVLLCAAAADPADRLANPRQEAHARQLFRDVRCLVCQSQSIDESDAPLAHDLRQVIRAQVADGRTDAQIKSFLVARYGQFVLLTPKASLGNAVLWAGPALVVIAGAAALFSRRGKTPEPPGLSVEEEADVEKLSREQAS
jgi:cytochrome c-type biogenesis protein CcmH